MVSKTRELKFVLKSPKIMALRAEFLAFFVLLHPKQLSIKIKSRDITRCANLGPNKWPLWFQVGSNINTHLPSPPSKLARQPNPAAPIRPGGTQIWFGWGCAAQVSKPLPIFKGHFGWKRYPLLRIFLEKVNFSQILWFSGFSPCKNPQIWAQPEYWTHV